ncbi:MAG: tRNA preQ1(34) S-adenosylmethionine ribosyltransferase-isomerase QueA [Chloroflexota bacterium]
MRTSDFDYDLPPELIAQQPAERRDASRLMVVHRDSGRIGHARFSDLPTLLRRGDLLVVNDSRVMRARLRGVRAHTGGKVELLLLRELEPNIWLCLARPGKRVRVGDQLRFGDGALSAEVREERAEGQRVVSFANAGAAVQDLLDGVGELPLPPYIHQQPADPERYQTVYARELGSVAAPTAGLHFTPELLRRLEDDGIGRVAITLHVGVGTFRPVQADLITDHVMHAEYGELPEAAAAAMAEARRSGGRVVAVGSTATRVLETAARRELPGPWSGWTDIFIYPGFHFRACDALITNFHLPRSSLLMLVSAFAGKELIERAYAEAIRERYRFFSFGDAMLIL